MMFGGRCLWVDVNVVRRRVAWVNVTLWDLYRSKVGWRIIDDYKYTHD